MIREERTRKLLKHNPFLSRADVAILKFARKQTATVGWGYGRGLGMGESRTSSARHSF